MTPQRLLTGWGRTAPSASRVVVPDDLGALTRLLVNGDGAPGGMAAPPMIARGLGRSYGDAAQCAAGVVIDTSRLDAIGPIHPQTGSVEVGGGVSLDALIRAAIPSGWFIPVSPGTRQVTVGGAIAADVHGKNHHRHGSFCRHVASLTLVTPAGIRTIDPESDPELFWATAGGMGLTGVVVAATLRLRRSGDDLGGGGHGTVRRPRRRHVRHADHRPPVPVLRGVGGLQPPSQESRSVRNDEG